MPKTTKKTLEKMIQTYENHKPIHKSKIIPIKLANVDIDMIPLVNWLNSFEKVMTFTCCQGDPDKAGFKDGFKSLPQISFMCRDFSVLEHITKKISMWRAEIAGQGGHVHLSVSWNDFSMDPLVFNLEFSNKAAFKKFLEVAGIDKNQKLKLSS